MKFFYMDNNNSFSIKSWHKDDRPREKLMLKGKMTLSNAELLAILIGSGNRNESAVDLCKRILASVDNNLMTLGKLSIKQLSNFKGIGEAKAITILAALELGKRRKEEEKIKLDHIMSGKSVFDLMHPILGELSHEEFWILYLNNSNNVISKNQLSKGSITGTLVDIRLVLKIAIENSATAMILCHNHPSGTLIPSDADKHITKRIKEGASSLDIQVLDHVIITENNYFSFAHEGII